MPSTKLAKLRQKRIDEIEARCRVIESETGRLYGAELFTAHGEYTKLRSQLGYLLLARDRAERPHIYA